jgi:hypothetical protein
MENRILFDLSNKSEALALANLLVSLNEAGVFYTVEKPYPTEVSVEIATGF